MSNFSDRTAIVTGGASGIGAALGKALVALGAHVVLADIDEAGAVRTAASLHGPGTARGARLDVTDADAVEVLVEDVIAQHGRLDLMFNNAGITLLGETEKLALAQWNSIIDINIRGVVHGVTSVYPRMIAQGSGQIINTASMGGLTPGGLLTSYVMTKHAVVGLSLALRSEAAGHGVGVTVVCPAAIDTPILDKGEFGSVKGRDYYLKGQGVRKPLDPDLLAERILAGVAEDKAMIIEPVQARMVWRLYRLFPGFVQRGSIGFVNKQRGGS